MHSSATLDAQWLTPNKISRQRNREKRSNRSSRVRVSVWIRLVSLSSLPMKLIFIRSSKTAKCCFWTAFHWWHFKSITFFPTWCAFERAHFSLLKYSKKMNVNRYYCGYKIWNMWTLIRRKKKQKKHQTRMTTMTSTKTQTHVTIVATCRGLEMILTNLLFPAIVSGADTTLYLLYYSVKKKNFDASNSNNKPIHTLHISLC